MEPESELNKRDIEFLYEMGCLRFIPRAWRQLLGPNFANVAEHTVRVMWLASMIAKKEGGDMGKVVKMALVHDVAESRTGDAHYISRLYTNRDEERAMEEIFKEVSLTDEFFPLWKEYEEKESLEARIVKDADNLDVDFEIQEQASRGVKLKEVWDRKETAYPMLYTETAKKIFDLIYASNPDDWHTKAKNRFTEGE